MLGINLNFFDWKLFWIIFVVSIPGFILSIGGFARSYWPFIRSHSRNPGKISTLTIFGLTCLIITISSIAAGVFLAPEVNARFIYFQSLINEKNTTKAFLIEFLPGLFIGFLASLFFLMGYYYWLRPIADEKTIFSLEKNRNHQGLAVRILFNGIIGEVIFRWGVQSLVLFSLLTILSNSFLAAILAIFATSIFYGLAHLIPFKIMGGKKNKKIAISTIVLYGSFSIVLGYLCWKFGIVSAMTAHALLHLIWYPLDIFYYRKIPGE